MKNLISVSLGFVVSFVIGFYLNNNSPAQVPNNSKSEISTHKSITQNNNTMKLGAFSISLSVKDLKVSKAFYEKFGFTVLAGDMEKNYLIMKNENALIGLFQGMFQGNILTFNPGWDESGKNIDQFNDIREIQSSVKKDGLKIDTEIDPNTSGPASLMITDPDGNLILIDQHR